MRSFFLVALIPFLLISCSRDSAVKIDRRWLPNSTYQVDANVYTASGYDIRETQGNPIDQQLTYQRVISSQEFRTGKVEADGWMPVELRINSYHFEQPDERLHTHLEGLVAEARWLPERDSLQWIGVTGTVSAWRTAELEEKALASDSATVIHRSEDSLLVIDRELAPAEAEEYMLTSLRLLLGDAADSVRVMQVKSFYSELTSRCQTYGQYNLVWDERSTWTLEEMQEDKARLSVIRQVIWEPDSLQRDRVRVEGRGQGEIMYHTRDHFNLSTNSWTDLKVTIWEQDRVFRSRSESQIEVHTSRQEGGL